MEQETKICLICNKEIKEKDNYVKVTDYKSGEFYQEGFYHTNCFHDKLSGGKEKQAIKRVTFGLLSRANKLMNKAEERLE